MVGDRGLVKSDGQTGPSPLTPEGRGGAGALHSVTKGHSGTGGNGLSIKLTQTVRRNVFFKNNTFKTTELKILHMTVLYD